MSRWKAATKSSTEEMFAKVVGQGMEETLRETSEEGVVARARKVEAVPTKKEVEDQVGPRRVQELVSSLHEGSRGGVRAQEKGR